ncbi:MAG: hypothetical protein ACFB50_11035 [Rubrobacteraceae bacterium]
MTEGYEGEESAQDRARRRLQELEEQRLGENAGLEETSSRLELQDHAEVEDRGEIRDQEDAPAREEASEKAAEIADQGQEKAAEVASQGREKAKGQISTQKERASGELQGVARALRSTGEQLREEDQASIGRYADQAAEQFERFAEYLGEKDSEQLLRDVEDFARSRPAVFLGGAFVFGVAAARFLKSSAGQTGDLKDELKQAGEELRQSVSPSGEESGAESGSEEWGSYHRVRGGDPR